MDEIGQILSISLMPWPNGKRRRYHRPARDRIILPLYAKEMFVKSDYTLRQRHRLPARRLAPWTTCSSHEASYLLKMSCPHLSKTLSNVNSKDH